MVLVSLALFFMLLVAAKIIGRQRRQLRDARGKLARLAATDNEIMCVLEATDTPLSRRLLLEAVEPERETPSPARALLSPSNWIHFRRDMRSRKSNEARLKVLRQWVKQGSVFTAGQRASIMEMLTNDRARDVATGILNRQ